MPLTKKQIEKYKETLLELKRQITNDVNETAESIRSDSDEMKGRSQHQADEGTDDFGRTISIAVGSQERAMLRQIERALEKIDEGTYGICDVSRDEIPVKRLDAIPYATMTVQAQEQTEKGIV
ncbi:MAG: General stress protein 16O [Chlamydiia bacterium]|nr:General stress protein 16O [Chlamydiia bacterium]